MDEHKGIQFTVLIGVIENVQDATGHSQVDIGIDAYFAHLYPERFANMPTLYELKAEAAVVQLAAPKGGEIFTGDEMLSLLKRLPGYKRHSFYVKPGEVVRETVDLITSIGHVHLVHEDEKVLEESIEIIRQWNKEGRFTRAAN